MPFNFNPFTGKLDLTNIGTVTGSGTSGQVAYWNGTSSITGSSNLTFDGTNLALAKNLALPTFSTGDSSQGVIYRGAISAGNRFLHTYRAGSTTVENLFLGFGAGNFTMSGATAYNGGGNIGIGHSSLASITNGYSNLGIGLNALGLVTTGADNVALGQNSLANIVGAVNCVGVGTRTGQYSTGSYNFFMGNDAGRGSAGSTTGTNNIYVGFQAGTAFTTASNNMVLGYQAGLLINSGGSNIIIGASAAGTLTTGASNIIIGKSSGVSSATVSNELNIGNAIYGTGMYGTPSIGIGITPTNITARLHLPAGSTAASSAPLKFTSGSLLTSAEAGAMEFLTDKAYLTITTGTARKEFTLNDGALTSGRIPFATTNGRLTDDADLTFATDTLSVTKAEVKAGGSTGTIAKVGGTIKTFYATAAGSTTETDLYSYTVPANVLNADGEKLIAQYAGYFDAGTNNGRLRIYFAGTQIFDSTAITYAAITSWNIGVTIMRDSSSSVECIVVAQNSAGAAIPAVTYTPVTGVTFSNTNILKITGIFSVAGPGADIQAHIGTIEWKPAA